MTLGTSSCPTPAPARCPVPAPSGWTHRGCVARASLGLGSGRKPLSPWQVSRLPHGAPGSPTHVLPLEGKTRMIERFKNRGELGINETLEKQIRPNDCHQIDRSQVTGLRGVREKPG